jgi:hypothetical protein
MLTPAFIVGLLLAAESFERQTVVVVSGAPGSPEYQQPFADWSLAWLKAATAAHAEAHSIGSQTSSPKTDHDLLKEAVAASGAGRISPLWLILIGHGTFDGKEVKFNLRGPDVSGAELADWLKPVTRPVVVLACFSASGPLINQLSRRDRVIVTATRSGSELNASRFGRYLAETNRDLSADLNMDGQVSVLEAFVTAAGRVEQSYKDQSRLATEHALLDDNGDGLGTPASWFHGVRAVRQARGNAPLDGLRAGQIALIKSDRERKLPLAARQRRDALEAELEQLRNNREKLDQNTYYQQLERILTELAHLYDQAQILPASSAN